MEIHTKGSHARILLSSVFGPYAQDDEFGSRSINPMELYHNQDGCRHMRLNFSHSQPDEIREGIRRLSVAVKMHVRTRQVPLEVVGGRR